MSVSWWIMCSMAWSQINPNEACESCFFSSSHFRPFFFMQPSQTNDIVWKISGKSPLKTNKNINCNHILTRSSIVQKQDLIVKHTNIQGLPCWREATLVLVSAQPSSTLKAAACQAWMKPDLLMSPSSPETLALALQYVVDMMVIIWKTAWCCGTVNGEEGSWTTCLRRTIIKQVQD